MSGASTARGVIFCISVGMSAFFVALLFMTPTLALLVLPQTRGAFRAINDVIIGGWFHFVVGLLETLNGVKMQVVGDAVDPNERTLIIMNHRTRLDWLFLWAFIVRHGRPNQEKIVLKASLKNVPGAGWGLQLCAYLFLYRKWKKDKEHMVRLLTYFTQSNYPLQLLIFPEGTDFCPNTKRSSDRFADKAGVRRYDYVLHPRTKGFATCAMLLRGHNYKLLNLSIGYKDEVPDNEKAMVTGAFPREVHVHIERHDLDSLPDSVAGLEEWCRAKWEVKEDFVREFYEGKDKCFPGKHLPDANAAVFWKVNFALVLWWGIMGGSVYMLWAYSLSRWWLLLSSLIYIAGCLGGGFDVLEPLLAVPTLPHLPELDDADAAATSTTTAAAKKAQ